MDDDKLAGMGAAKNKDVTDELEHAFGGSWAGFAVALAPAGGRFRLVADITLTRTIPIVFIAGATPSGRASWRAWPGREAT